MTPKFVVRGGYGFFYGGFENSTIETYIDFPFQFTLNYANLVPNAPITFPNGAIGTLETGLSAIPLTSAAVQPGGVSFTGEDYHMKTPYTQGYNLTLQYQLSSNDTVQASYVGNTVRHLGVYNSPNSPGEILPPGLNEFDYSPYPNFQNGFTYSSFAANSFYNSLQLNYERRFNSGLNMLANFTWSKCRTDAVDVLNQTALSGYRAPRLPGFGIQGDYGLCDFDTPKVFHFSGGYELPVGRGRKFLAHSPGIVDAVLGGWGTELDTHSSGRPARYGRLRDHHDLGFRLQRPHGARPGCIRQEPQCGPVAQSRRFYESSRSDCHRAVRLQPSGGRSQPVLRSGVPSSGFFAV